MKSGRVPDRKKKTETRKKEIEMIEDYFLHLQ
jgi:hypothetical protein